MSKTDKRFIYEGDRLGHIAFPLGGIGAGGLAILAALPESEAARIVEANAAALAGYPGYSPDLLRRAMGDTRARGYALNPGLYVAGSWGIGVPVIGPDGRPLAALSLAAIESRLGAERQKELVPLLQREAAALEAKLGGSERGPPQRPARSMARPAP